MVGRGFSDAELEPFTFELEFGQIVRLHKLQDAFDVL
jgi:hypothetical protein